MRRSWEDSKEEAIKKLARVLSCPKAEINTRECSVVVLFLQCCLEIRRLTKMSTAEGAKSAESAKSAKSAKSAESAKSAKSAKSAAREDLCHEAGFRFQGLSQGLRV